MTIILKGKPVAEAITNDSKKIIKSLKDKDIIPKMSIVRIGNNPDDISYEKSILAYTKKIGVNVEKTLLKEDIDEDRLLLELDRLNKDSSIKGVLMLRPFPSKINEDRIRNFISVKKDIDCMNPLNLARIFEGDMTGFMPCTSRAVLEMLIFNGIDLEGKNIVIINRTMVVGKPLAMMLINKNATVTICHSKTKDLKDITRRADIVVSALGKAKILEKDYFREGAIGIDVGMSLDKEGRLSGDINYELVKDKLSMITPVPGGVGNITTSILIRQLLENYK